MMLASAFSSLPLDDQIAIVKLHLGNELFKLVGTAMELSTDEEKDAHLKKVEAVQHNRLFQALPEEEQLTLLSLIDDARALMLDED